jgi:hypothetical protein
MPTPTKAAREIIKASLVFYTDALRRQAKALRKMGVTKVADDLEVQAAYVDKKVRPQFDDQLEMQLEVDETATAAEPTKAGTQMTIVRTGKPGQHAEDAELIPQSRHLKAGSKPKRTRKPKK